MGQLTERERSVIPLETVGEEIGNDLVVNEADETVIKVVARSASCPSIFRPSSCAC